MHNTYYKICLLGEFAVGKTSLVRRFVYDEFRENYQATIGVHITQKTVILPEPRGEELTLVIWDLAGGTPFSPLSISYYRGAAGALLVADLTRPTTVERLHEYARAFLDTVSRAPLVILLNKADLFTDEAEIWHQMSRVAAAGAAPVLVTSALTGLNVEEAFLTLATHIVEHVHAPHSPSPK